MTLRPPLRSALACVALVAGVVAVYAQVAHHDFVAYDSAQYITNNPRVLSGLSWANVEWAFTSAWAANWHPLTWISHMLDVQLFGLNPGAHLLENAAFHALNCVLLFLLLERTTGAFGRSFFVAALFALHPLHVESVAWIVERKDVLSTFFGLVCLLSYARYARAASAARYVATAIWLALGLLSKPMLVTWPCVMLLMDLWPLERRSLGARRLFVEKLPFFVLAAGSAAATVIAQRAGGAVQSLSQLPFVARAANALAAYLMYVVHALWPARLAFYYPMVALERNAPEIAGGALLVALVSWFALRSIATRAWFAFGWFLFLGTLVPVIGLVQVGGQALADRYAYVPSIGLFVIVAWGVVELSDRYARDDAARARNLRVASLAAACACAVLGVLAWKQAATWRDTESLSRHALEVTQDNNVAHNLLGMSLVDRGELAEACAQFEEALRIAPGDLDALDNYASTLLRMNRLDEAEPLFRKALSLAPARANLHHHLGMLLQARGSYDEALLYLNEAVRLFPGYAAAHASRGQVLEALGRLDEARAAYERAFELRPSYAPASMNLARLCMRTNDFDRAARVLERAVELDPANAEAHRGLARAYTALARGRDARAELDTVLRLRPDWALAQGDMAWLLATSSDERVRDVPRAVELGERAARASRERQPAVLDALARAYAASQRFDEARATAEKALARAQETGDAELAAKIARRLEAYRASRVDRETPR